ncbi:Protein of unknown function (DUF2577) [Clostridium sp. BNL1100]|nr:DUF2577 domain-containing protein [Clostridium sp. BNL1100]AEY67904.1 Protein of unknown function (DUF2577) [Clostridium sp. BNL1100]
MPNMVEIIKMAAIDAVNDSKPTTVVFGNVLSTAPLAISIDQKLILKEAHLILTNNVKEHVVEISDELGGKRKFTVYNGLTAGDSVIMIQLQGGQKYLVFDKVVKE